jgi:hypothetical protein
VLNVTEGQFTLNVGNALGSPDPRYTTLIERKLAA